MKISNKVLAVLLSVIMFFSIVPVSGYAESIADYKEINLFLSQVEALDRSMYTDESLDLLDSVVNEIDFNLTSDEQSVVDSWADELETALKELKFDVSKAHAEVLVDLSDKKLSADDILTVTVMLTSNFYIKNVQLPILFDKTQFEVVGNVTNKSYYTVAPMFSDRCYTFGGRADKQQGFDKTSNPEKWNTDQARAQYGVAYITASYNIMAGGNDETHAKPQNDVFITFELKALVDVSNALESVFISSDWAKTSTNKTGLLVVGMTTSENYDTTAELVSYTKVTYATDTSKHYYESETIKPTCTEAGYTIHSCTECDYSYMSDFEEASGHVNSTAVEENYIPEDCENDGSFDKVIYCKECGEELSRQKVVVPAYGHVEGDVVTENRIQPDCENDGSYDEVTYCFICEEEMSRVKQTVPKLGHRYKSKVTSPTCTEKGYTTYTCSRCGDSYVADFVDPSGHKNREPVKENEHAPTCENKGYYDTVVSCAVCQNELSRVTTEIPALGHDYAVEIIAPTCIEQGYTIYTCTRCGKSYEDDFVPELSHTEKIIPSVPPTCTTSGLTEGKECAVCHKVLAEQEIVPAGHDYTAVVTPPTREEQGYTTYTCKGCGDLYIDDFVDKLTGYAVSGTVSGFSNVSEAVTVTLTPKDKNGYTYTTTVYGDKNAEFFFDFVAKGEYTMTVSRKNHATRAYDITVTDEAVSVDAKLHLCGDITGDGRVNAIDVARANAYAKGCYVLTGYALDCANVNGDAVVNAIDVALMNAHAKGAKALWQ